MSFRWHIVRMNQWKKPFKKIARETKFAGYKHQEDSKVKERDIAVVSSGTEKWAEIAIKEINETEQHNKRARTKQLW